MPANDIGAIYTPSIYGRTSFPLRHKGDPIFYKTFDGSNPRTVGVSSNKIEVINHFFKTGEKLQYNVGSGASIGISTLSPGWTSGIGTYLPKVVYPIVVDGNTIRVALAASLALSNQPAIINSLGIGTVHTLAAEKQNSKCLVCIDNVIQSPVAVGATVAISTYTNTSIRVNNIKDIKLGSLLQVKSEIVKVSAVDYTYKNGTFKGYDVSLSRGVGILGTPQINFNDSILSEYVKVVAGGYNIVNDIIYFSEAPLEGKRLNLSIPTSDINFETNTFTFFTDEVVTGTQCAFFSENPPVELTNGGIYYIIKSANNTFKLAETLFEAFNGVEINFSTNSGNEFPVQGFELFLILPRENSSFQGRVFLRSNYDGNYVFDDVSEQFTGITSSFELKVSGVSTVGFATDNGIVLINNVFQYPGSGEAFDYREVGIGSTGTTFIDFKGAADYKTYDVNVKGLPRGGIIVGYGVSSGANYAPLYPASGVAVVSAAGTVSSIILGSPGSGYRTGITTYYVEFDDGDGYGSGARAIANPDVNGNIDSVQIISGGSGYRYSGVSTTLTTNIALLAPNGTAIGVGTTSIFGTFRGAPVSELNPGFVKINNEIIQYTGINNAASTLTGTLRGQFDTVGAAHSIGDTVLKYEYVYIAKFDAPSPYENIPLSGSAAGIGASVSFDVDKNGNVVQLKFTNFGYNYRTEEVLTPSGTIGVGTQTSNDKLKITITEVAKDNFSAWNIGILKKLNDLTSKVNGRRTVFVLTETIDGEERRTSLESDPGSEIDLSYNLLVFVNDVLQIPNKSYQFTGGSQLIFTEPPSVGSSVKVYFYFGSIGDADIFQSQIDVKEGDLLKIQQDYFGAPPFDQIDRTAKRVVSSDTLRTEVYTNIGLSEQSSQSRSISWTPQNSDKVINGEIVSKARPQYRAGLTSITNLYINTIVGINTVAITTTPGTFVGVNTNRIGINTNAGIGSLVKVGDYVEGSYVAVGVTVVSIGSSIIDIGIPSLGISTSGSNVYIGSTTYSTSPAGINTIPLTFYRINL
jgi:hypothetical protein